MEVEDGEGNVIKLPEPSNEPFPTKWDNDRHLLALLINFILEKTNYHEIAIIPLNDENQTEVVSSETTQRTIDLMQASINGLLASLYT